MKNQKFYVTGMSCANCSSLIEKTLKVEKGINNVSVNILTKEMFIEYDENLIDSKMIMDIVHKLGYKVKSTNDLKSLNTNLIISIILLVLTFVLANYQMLKLPIPTFLTNYYVNSGLQLVLSVLVVALNFHYYRSGIKGLFKGVPNMDTLITISSGAAIIYGMVMIIFKAFNVTGATSQNGYFEAATMVITLVSVGKFLELSAKDKTARSIQELLKALPNMGLLEIEENGLMKEQAIRVEEIKENDILIVKSGMIIPVDGIIIFGKGSVDEAILTGEAGPYDKNEGDKVYKATILVDGFLKVKALKKGTDSVYDEVIELVNASCLSKAKIGRMADKICKYFVPSILVISFLTFISWLIITSGNFSMSLTYAITVLIVSCPCALGLATPVAIMAANGVASKNGVLIKNAESLERLAHVKYVLCDKTGTITKGTVQVNEILPEKMGKKEFLSYAVAIERLSNHPLSKEIALLTDEYKNVSDFKTIPARGIMGMIADKRIIAGSEMFFKEENIEINKFITLDKAVYFAYNGIYIGKITFNDTIKESSKIAIKEIKKLGLKTVLISGDSNNITKEVAKSLNFDNYYGEVFPKDKAKIVEEYQQLGNTLFIGDGINDSVALTKSYVSMAIGSGADVAKENADIVLKRNDLIDAGNAIKLSKKTLIIIKENLFWAFFYNIILIPIAAGVFSSFNIIMKPSYASIAMCISSLFVVTNALRILRVKYWKEEKMKLIIKQMMCEHCVQNIDAVLKTFVDLKYTISLADKSVTIDSIGPNKIAEIKKKLAASGYKAR